MVKRWWEENTEIREVCGIEIIISKDAQQTYQLCTLKLIRNKVSLNNQFSFHEIEQLIKKLKEKNIPIAINISGDGIISKVLPKPEKGLALDQAFPGIEQEKFYIQEIEQQNTVVVTLIKKSIVEVIIQKLHRQTVLNVSLGGFIPSILKKDLAQNLPSLDFGPHRLIFDSKDQITAYDFLQDDMVDEMVRLEGVKVKAMLLNAFSQAFQLFFYPHLTTIGIKQFQQELSIYHKRIKIKLATTIIALFTFAILLVNFLIWNSFYQEKQDLENQVSFNRDMVSNRDSLLSRINKKESEMINLGIIPVQHQQIYYKISKSVPQSIQITSIVINPQISENLAYGKILVKGTMKNVNDYKTFKSNLLQEKIFSIEGENFGYLENKQTNFFEIKLSMFDVLD
jgi:hypothetical protein